MVENIVDYHNSKFSVALSSTISNTFKGFPTPSTVKVTASDGKPVPNVKVRLKYEDNGEVLTEGETDKNGIDVFMAIISKIENIKIIAEADI